MSAKKITFLSGIKITGFNRKGMIKGIIDCLLPVNRSQFPF